MAKLSKSEVEALVAWFAVVTVVLSDAALKILADEGVAVDALLLLFEQCDRSAATMQQRLVADFSGLDYVSCLRISNGVARRCGVLEAAAVATAASSSSSAFVSRFEEALAEGAGGLSAADKRKRAEELADEAAKEAGEEEGNSAVIYLVMWFGVKRVRYAMRDKKLLDRLQAKAVSSEESAAGAWSKHIKSREKFDTFISKAVDYFATLRMYGAVQRVTEWRAKLPTSWPVAKLYVELYMEEHGGTFPETYDTQLLMRATSQSAADIDAKLQRFDQVEALIKDLKSLKSNMDDGKTPRRRKIAHCYKCGDMNHMANACPVTDKKEAKKLRAKNNKERYKLETASSSDEEGTSSSDE